MNHKCLLYVAVLVSVCIFLGSCKKQRLLEIEPNDTFVQANAVEAGKPIEGFINTENDVDFYVLDVLSTAHVDIRLSAIKGVNAAFTVWRHGDGIAPIKYVDDMRKSAPERLRGLKVESGRYYISISHGDRDDRIKNIENPYTLSVAQEYAHNFEAEPNDSILTATPLSLGFPISGYYSPAFNKTNTNAVSPNREEDWFSVYIETVPVLCDIELSGVHGIDALIDIVDAQGTLLFSSSSQGHSVSQMARGIGFANPGNYYIMVAARNYAAHNDMTYTLLVTTRAYDYTTEMEPNNVLTSASTVMLDTTYGRIYPENDADYYYYPGQSSGGSVYRIEITPPMTLDVLFAVYNKKGDEVYAVNNDGTGQQEIHSNLFIAPPFYVKVWARRGQMDMDNTYSLAIVPVKMGSLLDVEPNDTKDQASPIIGTIINGYVSKKQDTDYYLASYKGRQRKFITINAPGRVPITFSITDSLGYILQTRHIKAGQSAAVNEIIDGRGYLIVRAADDTYDGLYTIEIKDKP